MQNTNFIYSAILHKMKIPIFLLVWPSDQTHYSPKSNYLEGKWIKLRTTHGWCEEKENRDNTGFLANTGSLIHYVKYRKCSLLFIYSYTTYYAYYRLKMLWQNTYWTACTAGGARGTDLYKVLIPPFSVFIYHLLAWKRSLTAFKSQKINSSAVHQRKSLLSLFKISLLIFLCWISWLLLSCTAHLKYLTTLRRKITEQLHFKKSPVLAK